MIDENSDRDPWCPVAKTGRHSADRSKKITDRVATCRHCGATIRRAYRYSAHWTVRWSNDADKKPDPEYGRALRDTGRRP